ncbi:MAG: hypothetical protein AVDCRST_MAG27-4170, partial [uncultured Craurococcus sp.]
GGDGGEGARPAAGLRRHGQKTARMQAKRGTDQGARRPGEQAAPTARRGEGGGRHRPLSLMDISGAQAAPRRALFGGGDDLSRGLRLMRRGGGLAAMQGGAGRGQGRETHRMLSRRAGTTGSLRPGRWRCPPPRV